MGRLIVSEFLTLDGVMEDPGGAEVDQFERGGWAFRSDFGDAGGKFKFEELMSAGAMLLGRRTYEGFAKAWPTVEDEVGFAEKMNSMPKYVVSSTLESPQWENSHVISDDLPAEVQRLKDTVEGDILVAGSAQLVAGLREVGLVEEYRIMVFPVVLGAGKRLFAEGEQQALEVVETGAAGDCVTMVLRLKAE